MAGPQGFGTLFGCHVVYRFGKVLPKAHDAFQGRPQEVVPGLSVQPTGVFHHLLYRKEPFGHSLGLQTAAPRLDKVLVPGVLVLVEQELRHGSKGAEFLTDSQEVPLSVLGEVAIKAIVLQQVDKGRVPFQRDGIRRWVALLLEFGTNLDRGGFEIGRIRLQQGRRGRFVGVGVLVGGPKVRAEVLRENFVVAQLASLEWGLPALLWWLLVHAPDPHSDPRRGHHVAPVRNRVPFHHAGHEVWYFRRGKIDLLQYVVLVTIAVAVAVVSSSSPRDERHDNYGIVGGRYRGVDTAILARHQSQHADLVGQRKAGQPVGSDDGHALVAEFRHDPVEPRLPARDEFPPNDTVQNPRIGADYGPEQFPDCPVARRRRGRLQELGKGSQRHRRKDGVVPRRNGLLRGPFYHPGSYRNRQKFIVVPTEWHHGRRRIVAGDESTVAGSTSTSTTTSTTTTKDQAAEKARRVRCFHLLQVQSHRDGNVRDPVQITRGGPGHHHGVVTRQGREARRGKHSHSVILPILVVGVGVVVVVPDRDADPCRVRSQRGPHVPPGDLAQDQPSGGGMQDVQMDRVPVVPSVRARQGHQRCHRVFPVVVSPEVREVELGEFPGTLEGLSQVGRLLALPDIDDTPGKDEAGPLVVGGSGQGRAQNLHHGSGNRRDHVHRPGDVGVWTDELALVVAGGSALLSGGKGRSWGPHE
mmetsp:Transcript_15418/g.42753  ORF Transcript_15418/g.42753 Transcript_15418/m.42753 type:complete len:696 (-) Transcript_15418:281-2368(-)